MSALPGNFDLYHRRGVQKALNEKLQLTPPLTVDGNFGPKSVADLATFQTRNSLPVTSVYDAATQAILEPFIQAKYITLGMFVAVARAMSVPQAAIQANAEVESGGSGFFPSGKCQIRFERHIMYRQLVAAKGQATADGLAKRYPSIINSVPGGYATDPYTQYNLALTVDQTCAMMSTSFGMFQIMGFNFKECGYSTVQAYVAAALVNEGNQFTHYTNFLKNYKGGALLTALRNLDWATFAMIYNGSGNVPTYSANMQQQYSHFLTNPNG